MLTHSSRWTLPHSGSAASLANTSWTRRPPSHREALCLLLQDKSVSERTKWKEKGQMEKQTVVFSMLATHVRT